MTRILVVDDDADVRKVAVLALRRLGGFRVEATGSGSAALGVARAFRPDLVLLDVMMPTMDGPAVLRALRASPRLAATPVVFMTARAQPRDLAAYRALGCLDVIVKPFTPSTLPQLVREAWHRRVATAAVAPAARDDFNQWRRLYLEELPERLASLEQAAREAQRTGADRASLTTLGTVAHRLAGSAAIYGLPDVSVAASDLDDLADGLLQQDAVSALDVEHLMLLARAVTGAAPGRRAPARAAKKA